MKNRYILFTFLFTCCLHLQAQNFKVAGNFNNWQQQEMTKVSGKDVYKYTTTLGAGSYQYQILKDGVWPQWWTGVNRPFTLSQSKTVTFYARKEGYTNEYGKDWMFFCDAQDFYLCGDVVGSWDNLNTVKKMTVSEGKAFWQGHLYSGHYQVRINSQYGLVDNDVMIFANRINDAGNYLIELDFETMLVTAHALRVNSFLNPLLLIGDAEESHFCKGNSFQNSTHTITYGDDFIIKAGITTRPVSDNVEVKLHYTVGGEFGQSGTISLEWIRNIPGLGIDYDSQWQSLTAINLAGTFPPGTYPVDFYFTATDNMHTITDRYNATNPYRIYLLVEEQQASLRSVAANPNNEKNYILTVTPLDATSSISINDGKVTLDNDGNALVNIQYYDGLGRPNQLVQAGVTPQKNDLITLLEYDNCGRMQYTWLPTAFTGNNGNFVEKSSYYSQAKKFHADNNPKSMITYDHSPLNRVTEQYGPGNRWHSADKAVKTAYFTNVASGNSKLECKKFRINGNLIYNDGNYATGQLYVIETKDEDNKTVYEFTDKQGRLVLSRQTDGNALHDTYYMYDDYGNLQLVIPPLLADRCDSLTSYSAASWDTDEAFMNYAYTYTYDGYNRCVEKKLPGCAAIYYVYDKAHRLVASQDGNQRGKSSEEWTFNKYDNFGRLIITGTMRSDIGRANMQALYSNMVVTEVSGTGNYGYTWNKHPVSGRILKVNYYDSYAFVNNDISLTYRAEAEYGSKYENAACANCSYKGLLTGTISVMLDGEGQISEAYYYDDKGRIILRRTKYPSGGNTNEYSLYSFTGNLLKTKKEHYTRMPIVEYYRYKYDHAGRLEKTYHKLSNEITMSELSYDEQGNLKTKRLHGDKETISYGYNVRSQLTSINSSRFNETLAYGSLYNGNISQKQWSVKGEDFTRKYTFSYDGLNRLTYSSYADDGGPNCKFSERLTYDKHGNILTIRRMGREIVHPGSACLDYGIDDLTFVYNGNRIVVAYDDFGYAPYYGAQDFRMNSASKSYQYDANGNQTTDANKKISKIVYNSLNLPSRLQVKQGDIINYTYDASGVKRSKETVVTHGTLNVPMNTLVEPDNNQIRYSMIEDYHDNLTYYTESGQLRSLRLYTPEGFITKSGGMSGDWVYTYQLKDHLGSVHYTFLGDGSDIGYTHYYPFGMEFVDTNTPAMRSPERFSGKEIETNYGLNTYDFGWRTYDITKNRFTTMDPLAEKYYSISPYAYCGNNPIKFVDPDGRRIIFHINMQVNNKARTQKFIYDGSKLISMETRKTYIPKSGGDAYKALTAYNWILMTGNKELSNQVRTLIKSEHDHIVKFNSNGRGSFVNRNGSSLTEDQIAVKEGKGIGTKTTYDFSEEAKKEFEKSTGVKDSYITTIVHEMRHQYDYDQGNMADSEGKKDAEKPSEKRAVDNENIARKILNMAKRTLYGGVNLYE